MTLQEKIGQKLVVGFPGKELDGEFIRLVKTYKIGNVVLFRHNIENCEQIGKLCGEIQSLVRRETGYPAFICIDQEGGCVTRLPEDAANVPGEMALSATGDPKNARIAAGITARELHALGVNFNYAPVADINNNPDNPIIGARCFGDTPETVTSYALEALEGYRENRLLVSAKHFPGHGDTDLDTHISLPRVAKSLEQMREMELKPFQALIDAGCPAIMTTHILFPKLTHENFPATMSRRIITDLLKKEMGFRGLVVSDCMEMGAIRANYGTAAGAAMAMKAGVDLINVSHTESLAEEAARYMKETVEKGEMDPAELDESVEKILRYKALYCREPVGRAGTPEAMAEARALREKTIAAISAKMPPLGDNPLFVGCPEYQAGQVSNEVEQEKNFAWFMADRLGGRGIAIAKDPDEGEIAAVLEAVPEHSCVVLGTYNGHLSPGQRALIRELGRTKAPMAVVALRNPYDLRELPAHVAGIAAWDYSPMTLEALVPVLAGKKIPTGRIPVCLG